MKTNFFLGSNSGSGFYSLYDNFVRAEAGDFLWVIKGGPGCGKSSFMKKLGAAAEDTGLDVEYIQCSGDPGSLDGVYIPALKTAYMDGTSPHVMDAAHPAVDSLYIDIGAFYDFAALEGYREDILDLSRRYRALYKRAYDFTGAAAAVCPRRHPELTSVSERRAALARADGMIARELGKKKDSGTGMLTRRFISALTCEGEIFCQSALDTLCDRVYTLDNDFGLAAVYLEHTAQAALERGLHVVACPEALSPERLEAVLLPELGLGFLAISSRRGYDGEAYRHIRLDALIDPQRLREARPALRRTGKLYKELLEEAHRALKEAKALHDELERIYNPHVNFEGMYLLAAEHITRLLG